MSKVALDLDVFDTALGDLELAAPVCINSESSILEAVKVMQDNSVGSILCLKEGKLDGIVTERDYLMKVLNNIDNLDSNSINSIMTHHPFTLSANQPVRMAMIEMNTNQFRNLPVVDEKGAPLFIVTMKDLVHFILSKLPKDLKNADANFDIPDHDDLY